MKCGYSEQINLVGVRRVTCCLREVKLQTWEYLSRIWKSNDYALFQQKTRYLAATYSTAESSQADFPEF